MFTKQSETQHYLERKEKELAIIERGKLSVLSL